MHTYIFGPLVYRVLPSVLYGELLVCRSHYHYICHDYNIGVFRQNFRPICANYAPTVKKKKKKKKKIFFSRVCEKSAEFQRHAQRVYGVRGATDRSSGERLGSGQFVSAGRIFTCIIARWW